MAVSAVGEALPFGLDLDDEAAAEHLAASSPTVPSSAMLAVVEQRDAVADALHAIEQMRRQQHGDAVDA